MVDLNQLFKGFNDAKPTAGGAWVEPGVYPEVRVGGIKLVVDGFKGNSFVAELDILQSDVPARPAGTQMSWVTNLKHVSAPGNIKGFIAACLNADHTQIRDDHLKAAINNNILDGAVLRCVATQVSTKAGGKFTRCTWKYIRGGAVEKLAAQAAQAAPGTTQTAPAQAG